MYIVLKWDSKLLQLLIVRAQRWSGDWNASIFNALVKVTLLHKFECSVSRKAYIGIEIWRYINTSHLDNQYHNIISFNFFINIHKNIISHAHILENPLTNHQYSSKKICIQNSSNSYLCPDYDTNILRNTLVHTHTHTHACIISPHDKKRPYIIPTQTLDHTNQTLLYSNKCTDILATRKILIFEILTHKPQQRRRRAPHLLRVRAWRQSKVARCVNPCECTYCAGAMMTLRLFESERESEAFFHWAPLSVVSDVSREWGNVERIVNKSREPPSLVK